MSKEKNKGLIVLVVVLSILVVGLIGYIVYDKVISEEKLSLYLPIYEFNDYKGEKSLTIKFNKNYKLSKTIKCKYENCYWYEYNVSKYYKANWIFYDGNGSDGGYYIYNYRTDKILHGPYDNVKIVVDNAGEDSEILQGALIYSNNKVGFYDLRGKRTMLFEPEYASIEYYDDVNGFYTDQLFIVKKEMNSEQQLYLFGGNELENITDEIKDDSGNRIDAFSFFVTNDNNMYFTYYKNGSTYLSRVKARKLDEDFNILISSTEEELYIGYCGPDENEMILYDNNYGSSSYYSYYLININNLSIEKIEYKQNQN